VKILNGIACDFNEASWRRVVAKRHVWKIIIEQREINLFLFRKPNVIYIYCKTTYASLENARGLLMR